MGNCLVTKLKGTVDNQNLMPLGSFAVKFKQGVNGSIRYGNFAYIRAYIVGSGYFSDDTYVPNYGTEREFIASPTFKGYIYVVPTGDCKVVICDDDYSTFGIITYNCYIDDNTLFNGSRTIANVGVTNGTEKSIKDMHNFNMSSMSYGLPFGGITYHNCANVSGDTSMFIGLTNVATSCRIMLYGTKFTGNVVNLASLYNAQEFNFGNTTVWGRLEDLLVAMLNNGADRTISFGFLNSAVTFNNTSITSYDFSVIFDSTNSTITVKNISTDVTVATYASGTWTYV